MHVILLTLREVMNNFVERGLHFPLAAVRESRYAREDETVNREEGRLYEIGFSYPSHLQSTASNG